MEHTHEVPDEHVAERLAKLDALLFGPNAVAGTLYLHPRDYADVVRWHRPGRLDIEVARPDWSKGYMGLLRGPVPWDGQTRAIWSHRSVPARNAFFLTRRRTVGHRDEPLAINADALYPLEVSA